jgi:hypothetical protein
VYGILLAPSAFGSSATYDGQWWLSLDERQRQGFVDGFEVCYVNLVDRKTFQGSTYTSRLKLAEYLQAHSDSLREPVEISLLKSSKSRPLKPVHKPLTPNETPEELHAKWGAHNDGDEWRGPDSWNLGYIQGFLECYSKHTKSEHGTFSKPPQWYADAIANWYGTKADDPEALDETKAGEKIPEVLFRFRDGPAK